MKKLQLALISLFAFVLFAVNSGYSQAKITKKTTTVRTISGPPGTFDLTGEKFINYAPSGNYLMTITFKLQKNHPLMVFLLESKLPFYAFASRTNIDYNDDEIIDEEEVMDTFAVLTRAGTLKITYHVNGAGKQLPVGWDFY